MNNHHYSILRAGLVPVFLLSVILSALGLPQPAQAGIVTGLSEYYIPAEADQLWAIFVDNDNNPVLVASNGIHYVVGVTASTDNTTVYYDHWEDGYDFDSATLTNADESFTANKGTVLSFESPNVPIPRASTPGP